MKQKIFFIAAALILFTVSVFAQDEKTGKKDNAEKPAHPMNIIKVNILSSLLLKSYSFQYERILNRKFSAAIGYRNMPNGSLPMKSTIEKIIGDSAADQIKNVHFGASAFQAELRFYVGKKGYGRGFYLAPFYQNANYKGDGLKFNYKENGTVKGAVLLAGELKTSTFGLLMGVQSQLGKHISLDLWLFGPHYGNGKGNFSGITSVPLTVAEQNDLRQTLEDFNIPGGTKEVTVTANGANVKLDGPIGGIRSGITIGVWF